MKLFLTNVSIIHPFPHYIKMLLGFRVPLPSISTVYIMAKVNPIPAPQSDLQSEEITVSPFLLWFIVSIAAVFFVSGILHILHRFFKKKNPNYHQSVLSHSNRYSELLGPQSLGRQLQQLFRLQDSGLDQSLIDNLPVFNYNDIITDSKLHPFDCAVCLCEFLPHDKLRLIPICSHGFHTHCIDTWLLSNSTCPLCRVNLGVELRSCNNGGLRENAVNVPTNNVERVLSVRLGKLESFNGEGRLNGDGGEGSGCNLDSRRCFSMGSFRYVVNDKDLEVALFNGKKDDVGCGKCEEDD